MDHYHSTGNAFDSLRSGPLSFPELTFSFSFDSSVLCTVLLNHLAHNRKAHENGGENENEEQCQGQGRKGEMGDGLKVGECMWKNTFSIIDESVETRNKLGTISMRMCSRSSETNRSLSRSQNMKSQISRPGNGNLDHSAMQMDFQSPFNSFDFTLKDSGGLSDDGVDGEQISGDMVSPQFQSEQRSCFSQSMPDEPGFAVGQGDVSNDAAPSSMLFDNNGGTLLGGRSAEDEPSYEHLIRELHGSIDSMFSMNQSPSKDEFTSPVETSTSEYFENNLQRSKNLGPVCSKTSPRLIRPRPVALTERKSPVQVIENSPNQDKPPNLTPRIVKTVWKKESPNKIDVKDLDAKLSLRANQLYIYRNTVSNADKNGLLKCSVFKCNYQTYKKNLMYMHVRNAHSSLVVSCALCSYTTRQKQSLGKHYTNKHKLDMESISMLLKGTKFAHTGDSSIIVSVPSLPPAIPGQVQSPSTAINMQDPIANEINGFMLVPATDQIAIQSNSASNGLQLQSPTAASDENGSIWDRLHNNILNG